MHKIAIVGANGQVGAEICLLLSRTQGVDLVPICRNPTGSAFLRYSGIACRHGRPADGVEAPSLLGDCDVIVNSALAAGTPAEIRAFDRKLIRNIFAFSKPNAIVIHFSTLMVHGDPQPGKIWRTREAYGRAKRAAERLIRAESKRSGKPAYILRLGHVCGPLQNITAKIRREIASGQVALPADDVPSNTVYTVTIVDAIMSIISGKQTTGAFDLTNAPQWTWRELYTHESAACGKALMARIVPAATPRGYLARRFASAKRGLARWARAPYVRRALERLLAMAPAALNDRAQAAWFKMRARAEISELTAGIELAPELTWIRLDRRPLPSLQVTATLLDGEPYADLAAHMRNRWPRDLGPASEMPTSALAEQQAP